MTIKEQIQTQPNQHIIVLDLGCGQDAEMVAGFIESAAKKLGCQTEHLFQSPASGKGIEALASPDAPSANALTFEVLAPEAVNKHLQGYSDDVRQSSHILVTLTLSKLIHMLVGNPILGFSCQNEILDQTSASVYSKNNQVIHLLAADIYDALELLGVTGKPNWKLQVLIWAPIDQEQGLALIQAGYGGPGVLVECADPNESYTIAVSTECAGVTS